MQELLLIMIVMVMGIYGWFLMKKLDDFLDEQCQIRERQALSHRADEQEPVSSGVVQPPDADGSCDFIMVLPSCQSGGDWRGCEKQPLYVAFWDSSHIK